METEINDILKRLRSRFGEIYGERLVEMVLFGSRARGDADPYSDIDVLVVLKGKVNTGHEIKRTGRIVTDLSLKNDAVICPVYMDEERYRTRYGPLLRNIRKEGIIL